MSSNKPKYLELTRVFNAPRERVFRAWTHASRISAWWGPKGYTMPVCEMDVRVGGKYLMCMRSPEGKDYYLAGEYIEITAPERLVMSQFFADKDGNNAGPQSHGLGDDVPDVMTLTVTFAESAGKTTMVMTQSMLIDVAEHYEATVGWNETFDRLQEAVESA